MSSSNSGTLIKLKCRKIRGVIKVRPPPGYPIAEANITFINVLKDFSLSALSYNPP